MIAQSLVDAKARAQTNSNSDYNLENRVEAEVIPRLAKEHGVLSLVKKIRKLGEETEAAEKELRRRGFSCDDDSISLRSIAPKKLQRALEDAQRSAKEERDASLEKYDKAILSVWAAETPAEAKKLVEKVLYK